MKNGDSITIVQPGQLVLIEVHFVSTTDYLLAGSYRLVLADDGVTWLKGYHTPNEECVSAARTCQALREQEAGAIGAIGATGAIGPTGSVGPHGPFGLPPGMLYPPNGTPQPPGLAPQPTWIGTRPEPWQGVSPDNTRLILTTSNTKGLM